jgi:hypothetical protein
LQSLTFPLAKESGRTTAFRLLPQRRLIAAWQKNEDWIRHRLLLTPNSAFYTPESFRDNRGFAARTAARFLRDRRLENCTNKQFLSTERVRQRTARGSET